MIHIHDLKFEEKSEFSRKFNIVSDIFAKCKDTDYDTEEGKKLWDEYFSAKYCLEQGLPL